jgi:hypothetical protein
MMLYEKHATSKQVAYNRCISIIHMNVHLAIFVKSGRGAHTRPMVSNTLL